MPEGTETAASFDSCCEEIAHKFVQTMVFMDDQAGYDVPTVPEVKTETPAKGLSGRSKHAIEKQNGTELNESESSIHSHPLNVAEILESAMRNGLVCSIHKPQNKEDYNLENLKAVISADIVCFDWIMKQGDNGEITRELVKGIIKKDIKVGGRHRLIAIYTYKPELEGILTSIKSELDKVGADCELDASRMILTGKHFRVLGLRKEGGTQQKEFQVSAKELPDRLVKEFSLFNRGLISNLTMASIAILRESTAHILAKLGSNLDGPFLTHKSFLPSPQDATTYASEIISSEFKSILHKNRVADDLLSDGLIKSYVESKDNLSFKYLNGENKPVQTEIEDDILYQLISLGVRNVDEKVLESLEFHIDETEQDEDTVRKSIALSLSSCFTSDHNSAFENNLEFLKVTKIAADITNKLYIKESKGGHGKSPMLTLGTLVKHQKTYLLCLQPSCDSVRLSSSGSPFWFIKLSKNMERPMLVVKHDDKYVGLRYTANIKNSKLIDFKRTDTSSGSVFAEREGDKLYFTSKGEKPVKYQWIADLKVDIARKIGQELANQYSRIGLDEFELSRMGWKYR